MRAHIATVNWDSFFAECDSVNEMWDKFKNVINNLMDMHVPFETGRKNNYPWFNKKLRNMRKIKLRKWLKFKNRKTNRNRRQYKKLL